MGIPVPVRVRFALDSLGITLSPFLIGVIGVGFRSPIGVLLGVFGVADADRMVQAALVLTPDQAWETLNWYRLHGAAGVEARWPDPKEVTPPRKTWTYTYGYVNGELVSVKTSWCNETH